MMKLDEAIQVLQENRPERPYKTNGRRLQMAIDVITETLKPSRSGETGRWKIKRIGGESFPVCPKCKTITDYPTPFCPNCGTDNRKKEAKNGKS